MQYLILQLILVSACFVNPQACPTPAQDQDRLGRVTHPQVEALIKQTNESTELDEATKKSIVSCYEQALRALHGADEAAAQLNAFADMELGAERLLEQAQEQLKAALPAREISDALSLEQLEHRLNLTVEQLENEKKRLQTLIAEPRRRADRRVEIPQILVAAREELSAIMGQIDDEAGTTLKDQSSEARRIRLRARKQELQVLIPGLERELAAYVATKKLLSIQTEVASRMVAHLESGVSQLREKLTRRQQLEADRKIREAQRMKASESNADIRELLEHYSQLTEEAKQLNVKSAERQRQLDELVGEIEQWRRRITRTEARVKAGGMSPTTGLLLRRELIELPDDGGPFAQSGSLVSEIRSSQLRYFELLDRQSDLNDASFVAELTEQIVDTVPQEITSEEEAVKDILRMEREILNPLVISYANMLDHLGRIDESKLELEGLLQGYRNYINERILWIQSCTFTSLFDVDQIQRTATQFSDQSLWTQLATSVVRDVRQYWPLYAVFVVAAWWLIRVQHRARKSLVKMGMDIEANPVQPIRSTFAALVMSIFAALPIPLLLALAGWRLKSVDPGQLGEHLGTGLSIAAMLGLVLEFSRQFCCPHGLAEAHFQYPPSAVSFLRKQFQRLLVVFTPLVFVIWAVESWSGYTGDNPVSRYALLMACLVVFAFGHFCFRPGGVISRAARVSNPNGWFTRFNVLIYLIFLALPLSLFIASLVGYHYTSLRLIQDVRPTFLLLFILFLASSFLVRWLRLLMTESARSKSIAESETLESDDDREGQLIAAAQSDRLPVWAGEAPEDSGSSPGPLSISKLVPLGAESRLMIGAVVLAIAVFGIWMIWADVFPALRVLQQVELWETTVMVTREITGSADGAARTETVEELVPVTLMDFAKAMFYVLVAIALVRSAPQFLNVTLLNHLPIVSGSRYAITTVVRWAIVTIALFVVAGALQFTWSKIQWLAAAVTIGLGFGLQEIFANFVSGLILLAERPVRVGDVVTIGDVSGTVTRIQMRATTVRDWKKRELIVPNKELVTGRLFNWTLSDDLLRIDFPVGVAYGSDTVHARKLMLDIAHRHPSVVEQPEPKALFMGFGDSALQLELRVFIQDMEQWLNVISEINTAIDREFKRAEIVVAYPQRDIHIRTIQEEFGLRPDSAGVARSSEEISQR